MKVQEIETNRFMFKDLEDGDIFRTLDARVYMKTIRVNTLGGPVNSVNIQSGLLVWKLDSELCTPVTMITLVSEKDEPLDPYIT